MKKFIAWTGLAAAGLLAALFALRLIGAIGAWPSLYVPSVLVLVSGNLALVALMGKSRRDSFGMTFLLLVSLKLTVYCGYLAVAFFLDRPAAVANAVFFLSGYVVFTFLEVFFLYRQITR